MDRDFSLPHIQTNFMDNQSYQQTNNYKNGSPRSNSRRLVQSNENTNLHYNKFCSCGSEFNEPCVCGPNTKILTPSNSRANFNQPIFPSQISPSNPINPFPDFNPEPERFFKVNVETEAFKLALHTLNISQSEYNSMGIEDFKRFPNTIPEIYAINILIESKKKNCSNISPIKRFGNFANEFRPNFNNPQVPQQDILDNFVSNSVSEFRK